MNSMRCPEEYLSRISFVVLNGAVIFSRADFNMDMNMSTVKLFVNIIVWISQEQYPFKQGLFCTVCTVSSKSGKTS